jgi:retron-type reverse transcriptase
MMVKANMTERFIDLVVPLAHKATDRRIADTAGSSQVRSSAVSRLAGDRLRSGDVNSTMWRGTRTSTTATRTTTTSTTTSGPAPSANQSARPHAGFSFQDLVQAYLDCRRTKRNSDSALAFEADLERNLSELYEELISGRYQPGRSICFVITKPKPREVWAAPFRDRIPHHLLYDAISPLFYPSFIADSCACIPGRGTHYAARRLEAKVRSITQNWTRPAFYLKCDLANFFVSIDKDIVWKLLAKRVPDPAQLALARTILFNDPRIGAEIRSTGAKMARVPAHKSLLNQVDGKGLPIGNLSSQFFANIYLNELDQFVKHRIGCKHYIRYVDDFILLDESPARLNEALARIDAFLPETLNVRLNPAKTIVQPVARGVDFVGQVIKPFRRTVRRRTAIASLSRLEDLPAEDVLASANSYFGIFRQASGHRDQVRLANALRKRGHSINSSITKTYRRAKA